MEALALLGASGMHPPDNSLLCGQRAELAVVARTASNRLLDFAVPRRRTDFAERVLSTPLGAAMMRDVIIRLAGHGAMTRSLALTYGFAVMGGPSLAQTLTCETSGAYRHCFDHHGYESTEERRGDYIHGWIARAARGPSGGRPRILLADAVRNAYAAPARATAT